MIVMFYKIISFLFAAGSTHSFIKIRNSSLIKGLLKAYSIDILASEGCSSKVATYYRSIYK